jgi:HEAT repeat protein
LIVSIKASLRLLFVAFCVAPGGCGRDPIDALIAGLHDPNVEVRRTTTHALLAKPSSDERVITELTKCTSDKDAEVRYQSVDALGQLGSAAKSSLPLLKLRLQDNEKKVRLRAAFSIQKIDPADPSYVPVIIGAMREGDGRTLLDVAALGPNAVWAVPTLIGLLSHESPKVRTLAARSLGSIGPSASAAKVPLEGARRDSNSGVQKAAADALVRVDRQIGNAK